MVEYDEILILYEPVTLVLNVWLTAFGSDMYFVVVLVALVVFLKAITISNSF